MRRKRGLVLAKDNRIKRIAGATWAVPSQGGETAYLVNELAATCSCPDYETRRVKCEHMWAVEIVKTVETTADGTTVTTESGKIARKTYTQNWAAYNAAQVAEKETAQTLLRDLCDSIQIPARKVRGRKPLAFSDAAYAMTMKVWTTVSGRRANSDINACAETVNCPARCPATAYSTTSTSRR